MATSFAYFPVSDLVRSWGGHFFDASAKRYFRSRLESAQEVPIISSRYVLLITSEQFSFHGRTEERRYSLRVFDLRTRYISEVGDFQAFPSLRAARRFRDYLLTACRRSSTYSRRYV